MYTFQSPINYPKPFCYVEFCFSSMLFVNFYLVSLNFHCNVMDINADKVYYCRLGSDLTSC